MLCASDNRGFTLVEFLVTLVIGSILLAIAVPSFTTLMQNNRRSAVVNEAVRAMTYARSQAVTLRRPVTLCLSENASDASPTCAAAGSHKSWHLGWIVFMDTDGDATVDAGETVLQVHEPILADRLTICGNSNVDVAVTFTKIGMSNNAGTIFYCDARGVTAGRGIVVSPAGRTRVDTAPAECRRNESTLTCA